jgi:hypothetical protein
MNRPRINGERAERRAVPKPARIPRGHERGHFVTPGDRARYPAAEGLS